MMITTVSKRVLAAAYRQIPERTRLNFERLISPIVFPLVTRSIRQLVTTRPSTPRKPVSIVIPSYGDIKFLKPLLKSIFKTCKDFEYEVIISDDFCQELNSQELRKLVSENVHVVFHTQRTGFAGAVNRGLAVAKWDVALLNSDMIALPGWLENLQFAAYEIDPKIGLVSPQLLYPSGRIQYGGTFQVSVSAPQWFGHLDQGRFANFPSANEGKYIRAISGAAVYIKKSVLENIGYFDDQYWLGFEDVDYGYKARKMGYRCYLEPNSKLIHLESATRGKVQGPREYASMRRFWAKWGPNQTPSLLSRRVNLLLSENANPLLHFFVENLCSFLLTNGLDTSIHKLSSKSRLDEKVISLIENQNSYTISLDIPSIESAWLSAEKQGTPCLYLLGQEETSLSTSNPLHISLLKPELLFIPSNNQISKELQQVAPWPVSSVIEPLPATVHVEKKNIILIDAPSDYLEQLKTIIGISTADIINLSWETISSDFEGKLKELSPMMVICFKELDSSFIPLTLMSSRVALITAFSEEIRFEVLDGYNSFTFDSTNPNNSLRLVSDLLANPDHLQEIIENASRTAKLIQENFINNLFQAFRFQSQKVLPESGNIL